MNLFLVCFISGASFLLSFLLFFHPFQQNVTANRWLSLFVFVIGNAFIGSYLLVSDAAANNILLFKFVNSVQFLLAPSFYLSDRIFFPTRNHVNSNEWIHPRFVYYNQTKIKIICQEKQGYCPQVLLFVKKLRKRNIHQPVANWGFGQHYHPVPNDVLLRCKRRIGLGRASKNTQSIHQNPKHDVGCHTMFFMKLQEVFYQMIHATNKQILVLNRKTKCPIVRFV
jgi:hypothetical protein